MIAYDDVVDRWFNQIKSDLVEQIAADKSTGEELLDIFMVAKYLERIGDHATNLAEWVEYAQTGARSKNGHWVSPEAQATGWIYPKFNPSLVFDFTWFSYTGRQ